MHSSLYQVRVPDENWKGGGRKRNSFFGLYFNSLGKVGQKFSKFNWEAKE
jgi:hypothetical protein